MFSLQFSVDDVARTRFGVSPMSHLAFGVVRTPGHYVGASTTRDRWWRQIRHLVPGRAAPFLEVINADWRGFPLALIPITGSRRLSLGDELDAVMATTQDQLAMDVGAESACWSVRKAPDGPPGGRMSPKLDSDAEGAASGPQTAGPDRSGAGIRQHQPAHGGAAPGSRRQQLSASTTTADQPNHDTAGRLHKAAQAPIPQPYQRLLDEDKRLRQVADGAWALYQACLAPDLRDIERALHADIQRHARTMAEHGTGVMLEQLHPHLHWHDGGRLDYHEPAFVVRPQPVEPLHGRGFHIMPCTFLQEGLGWRRSPGQPVAAFTPSTPATSRPHRHHDNHHDSLPPILGNGRANVLRAIATGASTTQDIANTLGIAPPSVSAHTNTLRAAGLIVTHRHANHVHHTLTTLGDNLLTTNQRP